MGHQPGRPPQDSVGAADQNTGGTNDAPPLPAIDADAVAARRRDLVGSFVGASLYVFAMFGPLTPSKTRTKGGGSRGRQGGGGPPVRPSPIWRLRFVESKVTVTPAMLRRKPRKTGKGKTGGESRTLQPHKRRKLAMGDFTPSLLLRDRASDWFKQRKFAALLAAMSFRPKPPGESPIPGAHPGGPPSPGKPEQPKADF